MANVRTSASSVRLRVDCLVHIVASLLLSQREAMGEQFERVVRCVLEFVTSHMACDERCEHVDQ